jgi:hypothetical protein
MIGNIKNIQPPADSSQSLYKDYIEPALAWIGKEFRATYYLHEQQIGDKTLLSITLEEIFKRHHALSNTLEPALSFEELARKIRKLEYLSKLHELLHKVNKEVLHKLENSILTCLYRLTEAEQETLRKSEPNSVFSRLFLLFAAKSFKPYEWTLVTKNNETLAAPIETEGKSSLSSYSIAQILENWNLSSGKKLKILFSNSLSTNFAQIYGAFPDKKSAILSMRALVDGIFDEVKIRSILEALLKVKTPHLPLICMVSSALVHENMLSCDRIALIDLLQEMQSDPKRASAFEEENFIESLYDYVCDKLERKIIETSDLKKNYLHTKFLVRNERFLLPISFNHRFKNHISPGSFFSVLTSLIQDPSSFPEEKEQLLNYVFAILERCSKNYNWKHLFYLVSILSGIKKNRDKNILLQHLHTSKIIVYKTAPTKIFPNTPIRERISLLLSLQDLYEENMFDSTISLSLNIYNYFHNKIHGPQQKNTHLLALMKNIESLIKSKSFPTPPKSHPLIDPSSLFSLLFRLKNTQPQELLDPLFSVLKALGPHLNKSSISLVEALLEKNFAKEKTLNTILYFLQHAARFKSEISPSSLDCVREIASLIRAENLSSPPMLDLFLDIENILELYSSLQNAEERALFVQRAQTLLHAFRISLAESPWNQSLDFLLTKMMENLCQPYQYTSAPPLGSGTFGTIKIVYNKLDLKRYAIKLARSDKKTCKDALDWENKVLDHINEYNKDDTIAIIKKIDWIFSGKKIGSPLGIVLELHEKSLQEDSFAYLPLDYLLPLIKKIGMQLISALSFLKDLNIVHADIAPKNILLKKERQDEVVLCDFGSSFYAPSSKTQGLYQQTRPYRSSECAIETGGYDQSIDMWSLGCVLIELLIAKRIFPSKNSAELAHWHQIRLGTYPESLTEKSNLETIMCYPPVKAFSLSYEIHSFIKIKTGGDPFYQEEVENFIDLVEKMLSLEPETRISAKKALHHNFFTHHTLASKNKK